MNKLDLNLSDIDRVIEITSNGYSSVSGSIATDKVNKLLSRGWKLLKIYTTCYDQDIAPQQQTIHYVLGITKENYEKLNKEETEKIEDPYPDYGW